MNYEGRQWLYRIFWRLSEVAVVEEDLSEKRAIVGAMFLVDELLKRGKVSTWNPESFELRRQRYSRPRVP